MAVRETLKDLSDISGPHPPDGDPVPGLVLIFSRDRPLSVPIRVPARGVEIGRDLDPELASDEKLSRRHATVTLDGGRLLRVTDRGSRNGTFVDGVPSAEPDGRLVEPGAVLRMGQSLLLAVADVRPFEAEPVQAGAAGVIGPTLGRAFRRIDVVARTSDTLLILGDSGTGKELAARRFHAASPRAAGPFVAVNCATIPEGIAERLLFGARRGAFSGAAADADGYLVAAHRGTLFLDELAELDPAVQPKLLRVLETREVIPLGDARGRAVDVGICAATLRDVPERVAQGKFREDLYYRMGRPAVRLPPLRDRREEIPFLIQHALAAVAPDLRPDVPLVELCLLRPWPGNVRELIGEARRAGHTARDKGRTRVDRLDLGTAAGLHLASPAPAPRPAAEAAEAFPPRARVEEMLRAENGNVTRAAQRLGVHRNQLRRWLVRHEVDPRALEAPPAARPTPPSSPRG
ncbi:MAG TPA: sigma 54-interacting transcriptional regulator [Polyangia bacterium]|nr:sigma 54-interacting transcriptional regulator [Polyangia bacterium]